MGREERKSKLFTCSVEVTEQLITCPVTRLTRKKYLRQDWSI